MPGMDKASIPLMLRYGVTARVLVVPPFTEKDPEALISETASTWVCVIAVVTVRGLSKVAEGVQSTPAGPVIVTTPFADVAV
jgi:hypothetical protein